ncbi:unnamed protein product [Ceutorhynchus assimilis]|uniref:Protein NEDD1 n=1 Tax=Ceutorhynchus assimilis TaxID=467358 RepID=A0A9N9MMR9_9CUCU|nr:unnamed protein product [Ceutorhynchus assimilis]
MFVASASSTVKFHDFPGNQLVHTYQPTCKTNGSCKSLSWSKDGNWLAVVPNAGNTEIVSLKGHCKLIHTVHDVAEPSCASFPNLTKRNLAIGTKNGQVLLYDIKSRNIKARYPRTSSAITHVGFTAKDTHCYAGCANGNILLFSSIGKNLSSTLKVPKSQSLTTVKAHAQKRNYIIAGSNEGIVSVWDFNVSSNKVKFQAGAHSGPVSSAVFSPLNCALIVSAGLDRVVRVFDIESNSRITSIPVENNILSLDFLENSLYIVMGAQNGKIHIYDTRNLQKHLHSFEAHTSAIKHITYQKNLEENLDSNNSLDNISAEVQKQTKSNEEIPASKKRTSDFFGIVQGPSASVSESFEDRMQAVIQVNNVTVPDGGDSFINLLGLDRNNTLDSFKEESADNEERLLENIHTPNPPKDEVLKFLDSNSKLKQSTSTPKFPQQDFTNEMSPIIIASTSQASKTPVNFNTASILDLSKQMVQGEVKKALDDMETKLTYQFMTHTHQIRRMVLDLHMASIKEFGKLEHSCNKIRDHVKAAEPTGSSREDALFEEIVNLKMKNQELESELARLKVSQENASNNN